MIAQSLSVSSYTFRAMRTDGIRPCLDASNLLVVTANVTTGFGRDRHRPTSRANQFFASGCSNPSSTQIRNGHFAIDVSARLPSGWMLNPTSFGTHIWLASPNTKAPLPSTAPHAETCRFTPSNSLYLK
jgi:hypothetical protein